jgi:RND family efflux transporter MFP subunit
MGRLPLEERLHGAVKARNQVSIRAEVAAKVVEVLVRSGDAVQRGQTLVRLQDDELREQLRQAESNVVLERASARGARARVAEIEAQVVRARELAGQALISRLQLETSEAQLEAARAAAQQAEARVEHAQATVEERRSSVRKTLVRAPVDGRVGRRNVEVGMLVDANTLLFEMGDLDRLLVEVPLTEDMLGHVKKGQPVRIRSQALREPLRASMSRISPFLAPSSFTTTGEIDVLNRDGRLRPGMFVSVDVLYGESREATLVPTSALWQDPRTGARGVFVLALPEAIAEPAAAGVAELSQEAYAASFRPVEVLSAGRDAVGVSGVEPSEWVVTVGHNLLGGSATSARVRPARWERVIELQGLQREDLLRGFLDKQRRLARTVGAEPPSVADFADAARPAAGRRTGGSD